MFAPPPLQLTRAQIEKLKLEAEARAREKQDKKEKRKSTESGGSGNSLTKVESSNSLLRTESQSRSPKLLSRKNGLFSRSSKLKVSKPIAQIASESPQSPPQEKQSSYDEVWNKKGDGKAFSPPPFGEQPRRAPEPPKRPARPSSELFLPLLRSAVAPQQPVPTEPHAQHESAPPVPQKSPQRRSSVKGHSQDLRPVEKSAFTFEASLNGAMAKLSVQDNGIGRQQDGLAHSPPVPASTGHRNSSNGMKAPPSRPSQLLSGVRSGKIDKVHGRRLSALGPDRTAPMDMEKLGSNVPRRATEGTVTPVMVSTAPNDIQLPWRRRKKGETMSMLLDSGFFPGNELTVHQPTRTIHVKLPPPLSLIDKDLPDTPDSILPTPTELYSSAPRGPLPKTKRKVAAPRRSPLAQLSLTNAKSNSGDPAEGISPSRLSSIPELLGTSENSPLSSGVSTPVATHIHLRGGSVITVTPPELTAWQRHVYMQGPIKLPKPAIMPRKNSVATLEAFQEAIDQVYQDALTVPRRRSDDAIVEDICEWFDDFGFEDIGFEGDMLRVEEIHVDEVDEVEELDDTDSQEIERFSTPPPEPIASPIEVVVAKEVIAMDAREGFKPAAFPMPAIPPIETEEALRARGIARLSQQARKESMTLSRLEVILPITPTPEESMLVITTEAGVRNEDAEMRDQTVADQGGMDWGDVEELDQQSAWTASAIPQKTRASHQGFAKRETKNPVTKMRRLMATASAIL